MGGTVLDGQRASRKKGLLWHCESEIYILCCAEHLAFSPLFYSEKRFAQHHVRNSVTLVSFIPILAFTTTGAFLANINWRYNNSSHAPWKYFYLKLFLRRVCLHML
jgi:hypothetical protein